MSNWHNTKKEFPEDGEVVFVSPQGTLATWNEVEDCWDDEYGDDILFDRDLVDYWYRIPEVDID